MKENLKANNESVQVEPDSGFNTLKEVPFGGDAFIGPIPEDLINIPENVARICLKERMVMDAPENRDSYRSLDSPAAPGRLQRRPTDHRPEPPDRLLFPLLRSSFSNCTSLLCLSTAW